MKKKKKLKAGIIVSIAVLCFIRTPNIALADGYNLDYKPYISLGADLKESERKKVLELLEVKEEELGDYVVKEITNEEEHEYLGEYLPKNVIGTRALSSVKVVKMEEGYGIGVYTRNIDYCTSGMYCNALITAGLEDADIIVAGPFELSGTAALVGAMKAYASMTGQEITKESMDAATNELVLTGEIAESTGDSKKTEELIALLKQKVFEENMATLDDIKDALDESCKALELDLTEEDKEKIVNLMDKIQDLDLDVDSIKEQAKDLYDKLADLDIDTDSLIHKVGDFFANIFKAIVDFFKGLFS